MDVSEPTDIIAFTEKQVARVTGLSARRLRYWASTGFFTPRSVAGAGPFRRIYSFKDVVGLRTIARLLEHGVPLPELRKVGAWLAQKYDAPWSALRFWIGGRKVYFTDPQSGHAVAARPPLQTAIPVALSKIILEVRSASARLKERSSEEHGRIVRNRHVLANAWAFEGTRIPIDVVVQYRLDGCSTEEVLKMYPSLTEADVLAAMEFSQSKKSA